MALAWKDVIAKPEFQSLPPETKEKARQQYFEEVVAPKAGDKLEDARTQFDAIYGPSKSGLDTQTISPVVGGGRVVIDKNANFTPEEIAQIQADATGAAPIQEPLVNLVPSNDPDVPTHQPMTPEQQLAAGQEQLEKNRFAAQGPGYAAIQSITGGVSDVIGQTAENIGQIPSLTSQLEPIEGGLLGGAGAQMRNMGRALIHPISYIGDVAAAGYGALKGGDLEEGRDVMASQLPGAGTMSIATKLKAPQQAIKAEIKVADKAAKIAEKEMLYKDKLLGSVSQGDIASKKSVESVFNDLAASDIKNLPDNFTARHVVDLSDEHIGGMARLQDPMLAANPTKYKPTDLVTRARVGSGKGERSDAEKVLEQLEEYYEKAGTAEQQAGIDNLRNKYKRGQLTLPDLNGMARMSSSDLVRFGSDGKLASTGRAQEEINTARTGLKKFIYSQVKDPEFQALDAQMAKHYNFRALVSNMAEDANLVRNRAQDAGLSQKVVKRAVDAYHGLTKYGAASLANREFGMTKGSLDAAEIEDKLKRNMTNLKKLLSQPNVKEANVSKFLDRIELKPLIKAGAQSTNLGNSDE